MRGRTKLSDAERAKRQQKRERRAARAEEKEKSLSTAVLPQREDRKRRHHYVWRHYLEAWGDERRQLWCRRNGTLFRAATTNVGLRKDFYQLKEMSDTDLQWVETLLIEKMPDPRARESARGWVPMFRNVFRLRDLAQERGVVGEDLDAELELAISNIEENLHSSVECRAIDPLDRLRRGDAGFLENARSYADFAQFLGLQYMRTPAIAGRMMEAMSIVPNFNAPAAWGLMRTIFATNIGGQLCVRRRTTRILFLEADASSQFIAGDQPIVNLRSTEGVELYYPLTPKRAVTFTFEHEQPGVAVTRLADEDVRSYNKRIRDASEDQLYAASDAPLIELF
jgi:hypothetical protein